MLKKQIFCTIGPSSLNKSFLNYVKKKVSLLRINLSHVGLKELPKTINFLKKNSKIPICIDTEGAQIRTKVFKEKYYKKNSKILIKNKVNNKDLYFYPNIFNQIKNNDIFDIGFEGLKIKIIKVKKDSILSKVISEGKLSNNKGVHLTNRGIKLNYLTEYDFEAIKLAKNLGIKNFALSFTNSLDDVRKFNKLLKNKRKIFKIESKKAIQNLDKIIKDADEFIIDRGDLSKEITIEEIPVIQRYILKKLNKKRKKVYIATNLLESMIVNRYPTRAEANDVYNCLELGSAGLVLAAETAIGKWPSECVNFTSKIITKYKKLNN
jgi:pyruvate kinase